MSCFAAPDIHNLNATVQVCDEVRVAAANDIHLWETKRPNKLYREVDIFDSYLLVCECPGFGHSVAGIGTSLAHVVAYITNRRHPAFWRFIELGNSGERLVLGRNQTRIVIFSTLSAGINRTEIPVAISTGTKAVLSRRLAQPLDYSPRPTPLLHVHLLGGDRTPGAS